MTNPWRLIEEKQYPAAIEEYSRLFSETRRVPFLHNRAIAYLLAGSVREALRDWREAIELTPTHMQPSSHYLFAGVCHWHLGDPRQAVATWEQGLTANYTDAAGGVEVPAILLYAAERLYDAELRAQSLQRLRRLWHGFQKRAQQRKQRSGKSAHDDFVHPGLATWPGPVVPFLLGLITEGEFAGYVHSEGQATLRVRRQCQVDFYSALVVLSRHDTVQFRKGIAKCADNEYGMLEHEYFLARWEVQHGFPEPAFQKVG
jgi:tetratricopeptide (TPR) repeat protein